jgi:CRISPR/Cas system-associated exonuclease Cas4 (RecB family)
VVASEVDIPPQELISGRADAVLSDGEQLFVLDIKSMNSMIFRNLQEPKEENINQLQLYLHYFKIQKGILLYVNKDNQDLREFVVEYNPAKAQHLLDELAILKKQIDSDALPGRIPVYPDDWQCKYCQFKEICKMAEAGEMKWQDLKTKISALNGSAATNGEA